MTKELSIFNKLGLVPSISSVFIEKRTVSKVTANLQINVPFSRNTNPWILDSKVLQLLNVTITICTNNKLHELLSLHRKDWTYSGISESSFINGKDYHQIIKKIQPSFLNFYVENDTKNNLKTIRTGFIEEVTFPESNLEHLSIFVAVGIDSKEAALRFKISPAKYKEIIGYCNGEIFIENFTVVNKKLSDVSILQNTAKFNFNEIKVPSFSDLLFSKIRGYNSSSKTNKVFTSELFYSIDKSSKVIGFFITDILQFFRSESKLSYFFDNKEFVKVFFSNGENFLPKKVRILRYDEYENETNLYDGVYTSIIETDKIILTKIQFTDGKKLYTSFKDKTSGELTKSYKYRIIFEFADISIKYIDKVLEKIDNFNLDIKKIINIAESGKNFDSIANAFNNRFYSMLDRDSLSIKTAILSVYSALSQFTNITDEQRINFFNLANSRYCNFEILEQLSNILGFLQVQLSILKITYSKINTLNIIMDNFFETIVDKTVCIRFKEEIIQTTDTSGYPFISKADFLKRTSLEIKKYYNVQDIISESKFSYFSPSFIGNTDVSVLQDTIDFSNISKYNKILIDIYFNMYKKVTTSKMHILDKLVTNLLHNEIDLNEFNLKVENIETVEFVESTQGSTTTTISRNGGFRVGDRVGSLLYTW